MTASLAMILVGMMGITLNKNIFVKILAVEVMNVGTVLLYVSMSYSPSSKPPIFTGEVAYADPVPQAVIITAIVIGFSILSLSVSIVSLLVEKVKREDSDDMERMMKG